MGKYKKSWVYLAICLAVILLTSILGSVVQSSWGRVKVSDLRYATNSGNLAKDSSVKVNGSVVSGLLFVPKDASTTNKLPAIVLTHGYLNNREFLLPEAIELSRRGFVVLSIDREGHGNYNSTNGPGSTKGALFSRGLYDAAKYLYNLDFVNKSKIGISGHSMGGFDTAATLMEDSGNVAQLANHSALGVFTGDKGRTDLTPQNGYGLGIISAGLMQGWDNFAGANKNVSVGIAKANDDEFFFGANSWSNPGNSLAKGTPSLSRQYLNSVYGAKFIGKTTTDSINIKNGGIYINGSIVNVP
ncbi:MAG TPA: alpha/beta hydrolase, partial [Bacillales bacterium]|nr:alpha/beta hydrolase [Bacillales bacterium]